MQPTGGRFRSLVRVLNLILLTAFALSISGALTRAAQRPQSPFGKNPNDEGVVIPAGEELLMDYLALASELSALPLILVDQELKPTQQRITMKAEREDQTLEQVKAILVSAS